VRPEQQVDELQQTLDELEYEGERSNRFLVELAGRLEADKKHADAARVYEFLHTVDATETHWAWKTAQMHAYAGEYGTAVMELRALLEAYPDHIDALTLLARVYGWNRQWTPAHAAVDELRERHPESLDAYSIRGDLLFQQGRYEESIRNYEQYLAERPQDPDVLRSLARAYMAVGEKDKAGRLTESLVELGDEETVQRIEAAESVDEQYVRVDLSLMYGINVDRSDWLTFRGTVGYDFTPEVFLGAGIEVSSRFDLDTSDPTILLIGGFRPYEALSIEMELGFTPDATFRPAFYGWILPRWGVLEWLDVFAFYRLMVFNDAVSVDNDLLVNEVGPGLGFHIGIASIDLQYHAVIFDESALDVGHLLRGDVRVAIDAHWAVFGGASYGRNTEVFFDLVDIGAATPALAAIVKNTLAVGLGVEYAWSERHGLRASYNFFTTDPENDDPAGLYQHGIGLHYWGKF
jgi:tetratricopeptide (TPR) repeat protein